MGQLTSSDGGMSLSLQATLDLLAQTIVNALGFEVAVVNLVKPDGSLEVIALISTVGIGLAQGDLYQRPVLAGEVVACLDADALSRSTDLGHLTAS